MGKRETADQDASGDGAISRRTFLRSGALALAGASLAGTAPSFAAADTGAGAPDAAEADAQGSRRFKLEEMTIAELQAAMNSGRLTALQIVELYLERIKELDQRGPEVNSVIEINPDARRIAKALDRE